MVNDLINTTVYPKRDIVFKALFGSIESEREGFLKSFLQSFLGIQIDSLSLQTPTELIPNYYNGKKTRVDVRAKLSDGTNVNIEMQATASGFSDKRCLQHWSRIYSDELKESQDYSKLNKTIGIWIVNENVFKEFKDYQSKWEITDKKHQNSQHFKEFEIYIIELPKFRNCDKISLSDKELWLSFIDFTDEELVNMACIKNKDIAKARKQLDKIRANDELMEIIRLQEAYECDEITAINSAKNEGISVGRTESKLEIAKKLKAKKIDINVIAETTRTNSR